MENNTVEEGKTIAIISYVTIIGLIIAFVMNNDKKNDFAAFHIRQSLGIALIGIVIWVLVSIIYSIVYIPILSWVLQLGVIVLWVLGLVAAVQGEKKAIPVVGEQFQQWFKGIGN
ncbi:MAG: hypothetical protein MK211_02150 [Flavobacteriales bacterium]|jgi:uncharacterized membrane protein|nr:hypothetical protein [Flavobacteriales bacterium]